ncbi:MAG: HAD family phosphatase [Oscillospiraceae bacterium]|nr:HAD family phosphatase [Oscillospiraceae bacterium]
MNKGKTVIFDLDGVLLDSERVALERWRHVGAVLTLPDIDRVYVRCVGTTPAMTRRIFQETYGADFSMEDFYGVLFAAFPRTETPQMPLKPGAREVVTALHAKGYTLALASSSPADYIRRELGGAGLLGCFAHLVSGDMVSHSKPDPEIFCKAAALCGTEPAECVVIEDSHNGIRAAHAAGMRPIMVPDILPVTEEMREKAEVILPDLFAVLRYLEIEE